LTYRGSTTSSKPFNRRCRFLTICGSYVPPDHAARRPPPDPSPRSGSSHLCCRCGCCHYRDRADGALIAQVLGHLLLQRGLEHRLGQLLEQPLRAGQRQALFPRQPHQLGRGPPLSRLPGQLSFVPTSFSAALIAAPSPPSNAQRVRPEAPLDPQSRLNTISDANRKNRR